MTDPAITEFFSARKDAWLKKNLKASLSETDIERTKQECNELFSPEQWLPNAAKRAGQISLSTHPCTYSHPSARKNKNGYVTPIIDQSPSRPDGYLRHANVLTEPDALGNAAALDVYKFLTLIMADGKNLLSHIEDDSPLATELLTISSADYQSLKAGFLAMTETGTESITSSKIKQVYFPIDKAGSYHQLSVLSASGAVFELRKRIDKMRFSEKTKAARDSKKNNLPHSHGFKDLYDITTIGYGGTKPQNISVLNNQNGGKAHLLYSAPPVLHHRDIRFPTKDFFSQTVNYFYFKEQFKNLHALFLRHKNDWHIRQERDDYYQEILTGIIEKMWPVRSVCEEQYHASSSQLNKIQKIWLCDEHIETRETDNDWLKKLIPTISNFIFIGYEKVLNKQAFMFSDGEFKHIQQLVTKSQEALR